MKKHYESSSNRNVELALRGHYMAAAGSSGGGGNQLWMAVKLAQRECDAWFSPQALRSFCRHTLTLDGLEGDEAARYRNEHSFELHQEREALQYSEGLRAWAEADTPPHRIVDPGASQQRENAILARARELRAEADRALDAHYIEVATAEYDAARHPAAPKKTTKGKTNHV